MWRDPITTIRLTLLMNPCSLQALGRGHKGKVSTLELPHAEYRSQLLNGIAGRPVRHTDNCLPVPRMEIDEFAPTSRMSSSLVPVMRGALADHPIAYSPAPFGRRASNLALNRLNSCRSRSASFREYPNSTAKGDGVWEG